MGRGGGGLMHVTGAGRMPSQPKHFRAVHLCRYLLGNKGKAKRDNDTRHPPIMGVFSLLTERGETVQHLYMFRIFSKIRSWFLCVTVSDARWVVGLKARNRSKK